MNWSWKRGGNRNQARLSRGLALGVLSAAALWPRPVLACAACFGRSDEAMARAMNMGILALLLVVLFVLGGIAACGIFLARRAVRFAQPGQAGQVAAPAMPPPAEPELAGPPTASGLAPLGEPSN